MMVPGLLEEEHPVLLTLRDGACGQKCRSLIPAYLDLMCYYPYGLNTFCRGAIKKQITKTPVNRPYASRDSNSFFKSTQEAIRWTSADGVTPQNQNSYSVA